MQMSGYRDPDDADGVLEIEESRIVLWVLLAPVLIGGYLVITSFSTGSYVRAGIGAVILLSAPVMIYIAWRREY